MSVHAAVSFNMKQLCQQVENASFRHSTQNISHTTPSSPDANSLSANASFHHSTQHPSPTSPSDPNTNSLLLFVKVHPHYAVQQIATLLHGKSYSAYAAKLISSILKNNSLPTILQFTKIVDEKHIRIICCAKNYVSLQLTANISMTNLWWDRQFADQIIMLRHVETAPKPCRIDVHTIFGICRVASRILLHFVTQHSVVHLYSLLFSPGTRMFQSDFKDVSHQKKLQSFCIYT